MKQQRAGYVGAAQQFLDITAISNLKIATPPTLAEQTAIAEILSDIDAVTTLEEKLVKGTASQAGDDVRVVDGKSEVGVRNVDLRMIFGRL